MTPYLSIIIPAYNEAERIPKSLFDMDKRLSNMNISYEIIVVDDGSRDDTVAIVERVRSSIKNLELLPMKKNSGKGAAVRAGMLAAKGSIRLFTDADNSTSIDQFEKMIPYFADGYDVVIGSRMVKGARLEPAEVWYRGIIGRGLNIIVQFFLLPGIWDTQCGFKAFTAESAKNIFSISKINGWAFDIEAISLAKKMNYRIKEIPVRWVNDERSRVRFSAGLQFLRDIGKIRWWLWEKKYPLSG